MASIEDRDRFFSGRHNSSVPQQLLAEGEVARLLNSKFVEGAISNSVSFDPIEITYVEGNDKRVFASRVTYGEILRGGDVQLLAPLQNINGKFLIAVISGILFSIDLETCIAYDITPNDACLPENSCINQLSYLDNDGGVYGVGGYLVIFNYPNRPIFVNHEGARVSDEDAYEMPVSKMGATAGNRAFVISGFNILWASDPIGGASSLAPLVFKETLKPGEPFFGDTYTIGSELDLEKVTAVCRLPKFLGPNQDFLAQNLMIFTERHRYIIAASAPRDNWADIQFITYAGNSDGPSGPLACTNIGDNIVYIAGTGRIKTIAQDSQRETALVENFFDDPLGQYLCPCEPNFYFRDWYKTLDHSRSIIKFNKDRLYATVYPFKSRAIGKFGEQLQTTSHRALAVASIDSRTVLGEQSNISWEGFYDWIKPAGMVILDGDMYVISKDEFGHIQFLKTNFVDPDAHTSTIYTRGYFSNVAGRGRSMLRGSLFFRVFSKGIKVRIAYLVNNKWICGTECVVEDNLLKFKISGKKCITDNFGVPLKIDIEHNGCRFELESVRVDGETHMQE